MKTKNLAVAFLAALTVTAFGFTAAQGLTVKRTPKTDATIKYEMAGDLILPTDVIKIKANVQEKVASVAADGSYVIEEQMLTGTATNEAGQSGDIPSSTLTTTYAADGNVLKVEGGSDPSSSMRTAVLGTLLDAGKPLAVGDKWSVEIKEDATKNIVAAKGDFEVLGEEKVGPTDTIKVKATITETAGPTPASSVSTIWVDKADGSRVKVESAWKNFPSFGGGLMDANVTYTKLAL